MLYLAVLLIAFGLAWAYTSFLESEPYAAYMGLIVFGGLGLILGGLGLWKVTASQTATPRQTNDENKSDLSWQKGVAIVLVLFVDPAHNLVVEISHPGRVRQGSGFDLFI